MAPPTTGPSSRTDAEVVLRLRSDDPKALKELMDTYWAPLVAFAHRMLGGRGDPDDLVQTAFVRLWTKRHTLEEAGSLRSFLYTIVRNASLDEHRKRTRREKATAGASPPPSPRTPYEDVQGAELQRLAAAAVARLPERRREVFRMAREEGLSYQEIADVMGLSTQTVANHMSLAMADLRTSLKPYLSGKEGPREETLDRDHHREQSDG